MKKMQTTGKKVITRVLGLTYAPCMDTYTNRNFKEAFGMEFRLYMKFMNPSLPIRSIRTPRMASSAMPMIF